MLSSYYGPQGYDMNHVYMIDMNEKPSPEKEKSERELMDEMFGQGKSTEEIDRYALAMTFMDRVKRYPAIESVALSNAGVPYGGNSWMSGYKINSDTINQTIRMRFVTSGFFDVFRIKVNGRIFDSQDDATKDEVIISPFRDDLFGSLNMDEGIKYKISEVKTLDYNNDWDARKTLYKVIGTTDKIRQGYFEAFESNMFIPLNREDVNLDYNQIVVRVKPEADKDFVEKFTKDMREQLFIGPYYLSSITSMKDVRDVLDSKWGAKNQMNSAYAITLFLIINIFLGILGSFWFRIQARRSEIGLRIALGSSKQKVRGLVILETLFLLVIASIVSTVICLNLSDPEIIDSLGIPTVHKEIWGIGYEQNIINFVITFGFLAIVSTLAVWYPARQASQTQPAEALHDE